MLFFKKKEIIMYKKKVPRRGPAQGMAPGTSSIRGRTQTGGWWFDTRIVGKNCVRRRPEWLGSFPCVPGT